MKKLLKLTTLLMLLGLSLNIAQANTVGETPDNEVDCEEIVTSGGDVNATNDGATGTGSGTEN